MREIDEQIGKRLDSGFLLVNGVCFASNPYGKKKYTFEIFLIHNVLRVMMVLGRLFWLASNLVLLFSVLLLLFRSVFRSIQSKNQNFGFSDRENTLDEL